LPSFRLGLRTPEAGQSHRQELKLTAGSCAEADAVRCGVSFCVDSLNKLAAKIQPCLPAGHTVNPAVVTCPPAGSGCSADFDTYATCVNALPTCTLENESTWNDQLTKCLDGRAYSGC
jgi:hypothetical protein